VAVSSTCILCVDVGSSEEKITVGFRSGTSRSERHLFWHSNGNGPFFRLFGLEPNCLRLLRRLAQADLLLPGLRGSQYSRRHRGTDIEWYWKPFFRCLGRPMPAMARPPRNGPLNRHFRPLNRSGDMDCPPTERHERKIRHQRTCCIDSRT
jgi:hypothetical protein